MMPRKKKLEALRQRIGVSEREALVRKQEVEQIVSERQRIVDDLKEKKNNLIGKLAACDKEKRPAKMFSGDVASLQTIESYKKRLRQEIAEIDGEVIEKQIELTRAIKHADIALEEFNEVRIEGTRVDKLIENIDSTERTKQVAREEIATDELVVSRQKKK